MNYLSKLEAQDFSKYGIITIDKQTELLFPDTEIKISKLSNNKFLYHRKDCENNIEEKTITTKSHPLKLHFAPIAALQKPSHETKFMFLRFKNEINLEKESSATFTIPCPIEIGVFRSSGSESSLLDSFSCRPSQSRFAVYGDADNGILCKYSKISSDIEEPETFACAKMIVKVKNEAKNDMSLKKLVFPMTNLDFYYNKNQSNSDSLHVVLKKQLGNHIIAEITPSKLNTELDWKKSPNIFKNESSTFIMESGFD